MSKVKTGESDPTEPNDHKFEVHSVDVSANSSSTISYDYNYDNEPIISLASDVTPIKYSSKGTSQVTVENNNSDTDGTIEVIVVGN